MSYQCYLIHNIVLHSLLWTEIVYKIVSKVVLLLLFSLLKLK